MRAFSATVNGTGPAPQGRRRYLGGRGVSEDRWESLGNLSNIPVEDRAELGSDSYDEEVTIGLLEKEGPRLGEINAALERIDKGTFGRCEECGQEISRKRLQAIPFADGASSAPARHNKGKRHRREPVEHSLFAGLAPYGGQGVAG